MKHARFLVTLAASLAPLAALAQTAETGQLLVATPELKDPNFNDTVLLLIDNGEDGSLAIFLNRPTWIDAFAVFPELPPLASYHGTLFLGGPVAPTQLVALVRSSPEPDVDSLPVFGDIYLTADLAVLDEPEFADAGNDRVRLYAGHTSWAPGQLEQEIDDGAWRVIPGGTDLVFATDPLELWDIVNGIDSGDRVTAGLAPTERSTPADALADVPADALAETVSPSRPYRADPSTSRPRIASRD